eukprot:scaffold96265_cov19-Prasinocladus_malaysianus.AAC.1
MAPLNQDFCFLTRIRRRGVSAVCLNGDRQRRHSVDMRKQRPLLDRGIARCQKRTSTATAEY